MVELDGDLVGCVQRWSVARPPAPRSGVPSLVRSYTYGSDGAAAACRRNISPVKSLARPPRRTARLACASRRAPTETRALLAQSNVQYPTRVSRSLLAPACIVAIALLLLLLLASVDALLRLTLREYCHLKSI